MELLVHAKKHLIGLLLVGLVFYVIERVMGARRRPGYFRPGMLTDAAYFFTVEFFKQASRVLLIVPLIMSRRCTSDFITSTSSLMPARSTD